MKRCRVCVTPSGHVRVINPNWNRKPAAMTDEEYCTQVCNRTVANDPTLQGLVYYEVAHTALPPKVKFCVTCGDEHSCRNEWRIEADGKVVIDTVAWESSPHVRLPHLEKDLNAELDKPTPDSVRCLKLQREIARCRKEAGTVR